MSSRLNELVLEFLTCPGAASRPQSELLEGLLVSLLPEDRRSRFQPAPPCPPASSVPVDVEDLGADMEAELPTPSVEAGPSTMMVGDQSYLVLEATPEVAAHPIEPMTPSLAAEDPVSEPVGEAHRWVCV